jgi:hypothetical protein
MHSHDHMFTSDCEERRRNGMKVVYPVDTSYSPPFEHPKASNHGMPFILDDAGPS